MAELIFILVTIYVVYVLQTVLDKKQGVIEKPVANTPPVQKPSPASNKAKVASASKKTTSKVQQNKGTTKKIHQMPVGYIKHPETGESVKIATSYRMLRKWIKEALVSEGLLEKVYKTNEIDDETNLKIFQAMHQLIKLKQYQ